MKTTITAGCLFTPLERIESPLVTVEDGHITDVQPRNAADVPSGKHLDFPDLILAPGFIDIHIHGGAGHDVMEADDRALQQIELQLVKHGVTAYLPTTVTAGHSTTVAALEALGKAIAAPRADHRRAVPVGIHLEGPFISHAKRGVHPPADLLKPSPPELDRFWQASGGTIRMMTIAPELPGALETIERARRLGVHSSLGHSNATYAETKAGIAAGADHATHTFNAMRALDHRDPGILGALLEDETISADIIADGIHVHPSVLALFLRAKGTERAILITDAISATGMPDGLHKLGDIEVEVKEGRCEYQGKLAGSVLTMDRAVRNVTDFAGWHLQQAVQLATLNPAKLLSISHERGLLAPGRRADLVALTPEGKVIHTIIGGEMSC
ncbi:MAG TPA: N-acetylglucosamine-6-phosphate deacetylase [Candidatus Angelobacter sp.]|jgi:N-acetylglucosamine-6-phosphate deacetylase|nr:N-acetylglucosamine-6-phosphate deacetylase [Candidatus Angelobacter sp.]